MQTGGAGTHCQRKYSGRPDLMPRSSQSELLILRNNFRTRRGFKSSKAFLICFSTSGLLFLAVAKELSKSVLLNGCSFFAAVDMLKALNLSCDIFSEEVPVFLTSPFVASHAKHVLVFRHCSTTFLMMFWRRRLSTSGLWRL